MNRFIHSRADIRFLLLNTIFLEGRFEIAHVQPGIGTVLNTFDDGQRLVLGSKVFFVRVLIVH